jgi:hypothetical protein
MSKSDRLEYDQLRLIFNNVPITGLGDTAGIIGTPSTGSLYIGLVSQGSPDGNDDLAGPPQDGSPEGYARVEMPRDEAHWLVSNVEGTITVTNRVEVRFPMITDQRGGPVLWDDWYFWRLKIAIGPTSMTNIVVVAINASPPYENLVAPPGTVVVYKPGAIVLGVD